MIRESVKELVRDIFTGKWQATQYTYDKKTKDGKIVSLWTANGMKFLKPRNGAFAGKGFNIFERIYIWRAIGQAELNKLIEK